MFVLVAYACTYLVLSRLCHAYKQDVELQMPEPNAPCCLLIKDIAIDFHRLLGRPAGNGSQLRLIVLQPCIGFAPARLIL